MPPHSQPASSSLSTSALNKRYLNKSQCRSLRIGFYGDKGPLGVYMNSKQNLTPIAELNIAKDYNCKINRYKYSFHLEGSKSDKKPSSGTQSFDANLTDTLKTNLSLIHELTLNSPNYSKTDTLTLVLNSF
jgi:hypothetical protein